MAFTPAPSLKVATFAEVMSQLNNEDIAWLQKKHPRQIASLWAGRRLWMIQLIPKPGEHPTCMMPVEWFYNGSMEGAIEWFTTCVHKTFQHFGDADEAGIVKSCFCPSCDMYYCAEHSVQTFLKWLVSQHPTVEDQIKFWKRHFTSGELISTLSSTYYLNVTSRDFVLDQIAKFRE